MAAVPTNYDNYVSVALTTDASGDVTGYASLPGGCFIEKIHIDLGTLASGAADVTITDNLTGESLLALTNISADSIDYVRRNVQGNDGADISNEYDKFYVSGAVKIVVAQGGDTKTGTVNVYWSR